MRDVLTEITGQLFRLAKSGSQGGSDVRTIEQNTFRIGLEGKRYGAKTPLSLHHLKNKVVDAALQPDPVDLWILAASREITATDIEALRDTGMRLGVAVLVLDWPDHREVLPDLAVLCLEAPAALKRHLGGDRALARSYTLLGFCDQTPIFEAIWSEFETRRPRASWLEQVFATSNEAYRRNKWAREWFDRYLRATDGTSAFAAYELVLRTVVGRASARRRNSHGLRLQFGIAFRQGLSRCSWLRAQSIATSTGCGRPSPEKRRVLP